MCRKFFSSQYLRRSPIPGLAVRILIYAVLLAGLTQLIALQAYQVHADDLYAEGSLIEWLQVTFILLTIAVITGIGSLDRSKRSLSILMIGMLLMATIREFDWTLDAYVFDGAWQLAVACTLLVTIMLVFRQRQTLMPAIQDFVNEPAFGIMLSGFLILFVFSRLFGQTSFWRAVMGHRYLFSVKNAAEEGTELLGYFFLFISAIEWLRTTRMNLEAKSQ